MQDEARAAASLVRHSREGGNPGGPTPARSLGAANQHSLEQVQRLCNKAMILEKGKLIAYGDIDEISAKYAEMIR